MKTTKVNRIELDDLDSNVEIVLGGGIIKVHIKPQGLPYVVIDTDPNMTCGSPYLRLSSEVCDCDGQYESNHRKIEDAYAHRINVGLVNQ